MLKILLLHSVHALALCCLDSLDYIVENSCTDKSLDAVIVSLSVIYIAWWYRCVHRPSPENNRTVIYTRKTNQLTVLQLMSPLK